MEWISVKDKLPEFDKKVIAYDASKNIVILRLHKITGVQTSTGNDVSTEWYERSSYDDYYDDVTHWMPLPEPPKVVAPSLK